MKALVVVVCAVVLVTSACASGQSRPPRTAASVRVTEVYSIAAVRRAFEKVRIRLIAGGDGSRFHEFVPVDAASGASIGGYVDVVRTARAARQYAAGLNQLRTAGVASAVKGNVVVKLTPPWTKTDKARLLRGLAELVVGR
jgi:hypothetical protein